MVEKCRQSCGFGFFVIDAVIERIVALVNNLMLLISEVEGAVTLNLGAVGYLRQDGAQLGEVVKELLLLDKLVLAAPVLVELVGQKIERRKLVKAVLTCNHGDHINKGGGTVDAGFLQLDGSDDGIGLEEKGKIALLGETARCIDEKVEILVAHGSYKVECFFLAAELGTWYDLIQRRELWPSLTVLLVFFDNAALRVAVKHDETAMVFEYKLTGAEHTVGGFAAAAFLVSKHNNLVASLLGGLPDVKEWYVHKVGCW
mgnify:FL=1